ncbi:MATH domain and coiled-coil domain-containing protein At3g58270-like isoform X2 [Rhododendron vialii]|uniref:MATH domain and coiled-coil domain-containing protein At3g58270-like isoform X2 n=1 Tax=Rhododendron vialii TaxID=182163 RepID=UPI00265E8FD5|nr:MATH domain and coiled-coil domain-containing protein At3g58270-like isoform X2 [Rhododendron vialii]
MSLPTPTDRPSKPFTWKIENFSKRKTKKLYSDTFYSGGYEWRVLIYPKGNNVEYLSLYLDVGDLATLPYGWTRYAQFSISVINQSHNTLTVRKDTQHQFDAREFDWGFTSFLPLKVLNDPGQGFLLNDTIIVEADVTVPNPHNSKLETVENSNPESTLQSTLGSQIAFVDGSSEATATAGKVRFLSYWVSSEGFQLLEKIHGLHKGTFVKFSMKGQALQTVLLESFASFIASMSSTKVSEVNEEALRLAAISIEDYEQVGLDLRWLKQRLEEAKGVKKHSESVNTVESCGSSLEVARAKVRELEEGLAKAKAEVEAMSRDLPKSLGVNDSVLKDIV